MATLAIQQKFARACLAPSTPSATACVRCRRCAWIGCSSGRRHAKPACGPPAHSRAPTQPIARLRCRPGGLHACSSSGPGAALGQAAPPSTGRHFEGQHRLAKESPRARRPTATRRPELPPALGIEVHSVRPRRKHGTVSSVPDNGQRSGSAQRTPSRPVSSAMTTGQTRSRPGSTGRQSISAADDANGVDANAGFGVWGA